ncbi:hypothetical protein [Paenibacillus sp. FSL H7-0331]|uniref:hypothetical protein n=1 Tax=Paenibacillus sp. FSL H7-0331 TaxID=1920421 RepID=UPI00096C3BF5|nr:hypothetical protein [Paenibacillus sp. FSL H7-0331]OMF08755.1 hypothetical protein BK127_27825 [Paenibacillus sp. FSL H7-0331]
MNTNKVIFYLGIGEFIFAFLFIGLLFLDIHPENIWTKICLGISAVAFIYNGTSKLKKQSRNRSR